MDGTGALAPVRLSPPRPSCSAPSGRDRKSTRLNSSHMSISYAVFCLKKKTKVERYIELPRSAGASLLSRRQRPDAPDLATGFFPRPMVLAGCHRHITVVHDEVVCPFI